MKQSVITGLFLLLSVLGFPQGEFNKWYFGIKAGVSFNTGFPVAFTYNNLVGGAGTSTSVSDSNGSTLFYSNGFQVFNKNNIQMPNGYISGFQCSTDFYQINLAVKWLNDDQKYYFFTTACWHPSDPGVFRYSVIDMTLDGGNGDIPLSMNGIHIPGGMRAYHSVTGTRHQNNHDAWVVVRLQSTDSNYFSSYLVNSAGINFTPVFSNSLVNLFTPPAMNGEIRNMRISKDGSKMVANYDTITEFCQFDDATGHVNPLFTFYLPKLGNYLTRPGSSEFSLDSKLLYITGNTSNGGVLFQYDATKTDSAQFVQSAVFLGFSNDNALALQMATDWKIYASCPQNDSLSVIKNPSVPGIGCNYQFNSLSLLGRNGGSGLPQFIERYYAIINDAGHCQYQPILFNPAIWPPADSIHWDFGDPASGMNNYSNLQNATHIYSSIGTYTVELFVKHNDNRTDTAWKTINIISTPQVDLGPDQTICLGDSVTFDAGACSGCTYHWSDLTHGLLNIGTNQTYTAHNAAQYMVMVGTGTNDCFGTDTVVLNTSPVPVVTNNPLSKVICSEESTNIVLTSNAPGANFYWTASLTSGNITGFNADSGLVINEVLVNHNPSPGVVIYHITPKVGSCIGTPSDYAVTVNPGDSVKISIAASANNVCAGTSVTFIASPTNGGINPGYQWKVNSTDIGTNNPVFTYTPISGDQVTCILTSSNTICTTNNPATSNSITMVVNPNLPVSVSVVVSLNPVCVGTSVTYTATPTHGGITPQYQWKVNGGNVGINNSIYSYTPNNGDTITCTLTSSETCTTGNPAISNQIIMTVNPKLPVSISISASSNPFCIGNSVTFTATHTNGGSSPSYQWKVNGTNVSIDTLYTYYPVSGDMVSCVFTSSASCVTGNPTTSNTITMTGTTGLPVGVSIVATPNPFCPGSSVTCTATPSNGGTNPVYQWKVNGVNVGINSPTYTFNPLNNDSVRCVMTSNLSCVSGNPATSNKIILSGTLAPIVTFTSCFDSITTLNAKPIKLKGGIPLGGTYSGPGVNSVTGVFTPSVAGIGTKTITYSYANVALCSASKTKTIIVRSAAAFICGNNLTDIRDNKVYPTVQIASQCWMAADLNYGLEIPPSQHQRDNCTPEKYFNPGSSIQHPASVYQWDELMCYDDTPGLQGLCPPGWHVPTEAEWNTLFANWTNNAFAGAPLKYSGYSGFNAILSGVRHLNVQWDYQNFATFFWSSTPYGAYKAWAHGMNDYNFSVSYSPSYRANAFSVRCLKD